MKAAFLDPRRNVWAAFAIWCALVGAAVYYAPEAEPIDFPTCIAAPGAEELARGLREYCAEACAHAGQAPCEVVASGARSCVRNCNGYFVAFEGPCVGVGER